MKKIYTLLFLLYVFSRAYAQVQPYGIVDTADLKLKTCDFEKDAPAEILFNYCKISYDGYSHLVKEYHKRIKIFTKNKAADYATISLLIPNNRGIMRISDQEAESINLENGNIVVSKIDNKSIYRQKINQLVSRIFLTFPEVKDGTILDLKYKEILNSSSDLPDWYFQEDLPIRYSKCSIKVPKGFKYDHELFVKQELAEETDTVVAMANVPSLGKEPFMDTFFGNLQHVSFKGVSRGSRGIVLNGVDASWQQLGSDYLFAGGIKDQLSTELKNENLLIESSFNMTPVQKMAYLFKTVRDTMTCDNETFYEFDNLSKAWNRKKCSTIKINLILCRILTLAGLDAGILKASSNKDIRVNPAKPSGYNLDKTLVYVQIDKDNYYVLDASGKSNKWNEVPKYLLNTYALYINSKHLTAGLYFIEDIGKERNVVAINADILQNGKLTGTAQISNVGYNRLNTLEKYKKENENDYLEELRDHNNSLKITSFKISNANIDTLPLIQDIGFTFNSEKSDDNYIYINPKIFTDLNSNPFINPKRVSNIDFGFRNNYSISGRFSIPKGYTVDALPKSVTMMMPDSSIRFKQLVSVDDNMILVYYILDYSKSYFDKDQYDELYQFYKKMYEMLNQPVVLKKA